MITNQSSKNVRLTWSAYLRTYIVTVDGLGDCENSELGLIRQDCHTYPQNIRICTEVENACVRSDCDLKDATINITDA